MRKVLVSATLAGVAVALATGPASAASSSLVPVPVPVHPATAGLKLLGASAQGVVVRQDAVPDGTAQPIARVFSGAEGSQLAHRPAMEQTAEDLYWNRGPADVVAVTGTTVAWYQSARISACNCNWTEAHRMDLRTGADVDDGEVPPPLANSGSLWFSTQIGSFSTFPFKSGLRKYTAASPGSFMPDTLVDQQGIDLATDGNTGLMASYTLADPTDSTSAKTYHLDLVDLTTLARTPVWQGPDALAHVAISADTLAWDSQASGGTLKINRRARSGGPTTSYTETGSASELYLAHGTVGYLVTANGAPAARIVSGATARTVALPAGSSGFASDGTRFVTATAATAATAGVYGVPATGSGGFTRVATVPPATYPLGHVTLSGGQLHYADSSRTDLDGRPLWMRTVSGNNHPKLSGETLMTLPTGSGAATYAGAATSFSDGRAAVVATGGSSAVRLFDRDEPTGIVSDPPQSWYALPDARLDGALKVSGPYVLVSTDVYRPDGEHVYSPPSLLGDVVGQPDLYGASEIYALKRSDSGDLAIYVEASLETTNPTLLKTVPAADVESCATPKVAVWGQYAAWTNCDGGSLTVENWITKAARTVPAAASGDAGTVLDVALGEGTLGWRTSGGVDLLDLTSPSSHAVGLSGSYASFALDDHRIALTTSEGTAVVQQLPFGNEKYQPRLIGTYALHVFTPGSGANGTWKPQFDVSKPLRGVELTITDKNGKKVVDLDGTAPDGSIRDLSWDGKDRKGVAVPSGVYTWTLSARADDGDGTLVNQTADATPLGYLEVDAAS